MNLAPLKRVFWKSVTEAHVDSGRVMTLPSTLTRDTAKEIVDELPMDQLVNDLATFAAKAVGDLMQSRSLRPADYPDIKDIPDAVLEKLIEALAKKPEKFFAVFAEHLKMQG